MEEGQEKSRVNWPIVIIVIFVIAAGVWYVSSREPETAPGSSPAASSKAPDIKTFKLRAENGRFSPSEFSVKRGPTLVIEFTAIDAKYDFGFEDPKIGFNVILEPGMTQRFGFETSDKTPGLYKFRCIQFCPKGEMTGVLQIE